MQVYMGGIVPTSFPNWKKSTCLMISLAGCDFNCPYCNSPLFLDFREEYLIDLLEAKRQINGLAGSVEAVVFSGGEPCLQRQALLNLARHCKQIGLEVGILTNGSRPSAILSLIRENILDFIEVDLKVPLEEEIFQKTTRSKTFFKPTSEIIGEIKETIDLLKKHETRLKINFTTTIVAGINDRKADLEKIGNLIKHVRAVWILQGFNPSAVTDKQYREMPPFPSEELLLIKTSMQKHFPQMQIETA